MVAYDFPRGGNLPPLLSVLQAEAGFGGFSEREEREATKKQLR